MSTSSKQLFTPFFTPFVSHIANLSRRTQIGVAVTGVVGLIAFSLVFSAASLADAPVKSESAPKYRTAPVCALDQGAHLTVDGVVEAVRFTTIATQVPGAIVQLPVKAGDVVKAGQLLLRLDARAAQQEALASRSQVDAATAALTVAEKDLERQKLLFEKNYISQAQWDRASAQFKAASAQAKAQIAQAAAKQTQSGFYAIHAPYDGVVATMPSSLGEMAMPGKALMSVYDPREMRVMVNVPAARIASLKKDQNMLISFPSLPQTQAVVKASSMKVMPALDPATHTVQVRFDLPASVMKVSPGLFARVNLAFESSTTSSASGVATSRLFVPRAAVFRRAELSAVYVVNSQGKLILRQVKPGPVNGNEQEILSGVAAGEAVVLDPLQASAASLK